jgi:hypothetical protein
MSGQQFGAGVLYATPLYNALGVAISNPSPVQFGIVQGVDLGDEADIKELYGNLQYPVDIGRGKAKMMIKCQQAIINAQLFNAVYFGQTLGTGYNAISTDYTGSLVATGAGATSVGITPTAPLGGTSVFVADLGVTDVNGVPLTRVASAPTGGQYSVTGIGSALATYTFGNAQAGSTVFINYNYSNATTPSTQKSLTVYNLPMGNVPVFSAQFFIGIRQGQSMWVKYPMCVATKLGMSFKNDDFVIPDFEMSAFADSANVAKYYSFSS